MTKHVKNYSNKSKNDILRFKKATKQRKRVMIAKDVLAQLAANRFIAAQGTWIGTLDDAIMYGDKDNDVQKIVCEQNQCEVCGIGAVFVSTVEFANRLKAGELNIHGESGDFGGYAEYLTQWFSMEQLRLIELAFESGSGGCRTSEKTSEKNAVKFFDFLDLEFNKFDADADERMRLIMENIIANKGEFRPEYKPYCNYTLTTPGFKS